MKTGVERVCLAAVVWLALLFAARVRLSEGGVEGNDVPYAVPGCALRESAIPEEDVAAEAFAFVVEDAAAASELERAKQEELVTRNGVRMTRVPPAAKRRKEQRNTAGKRLYRRMLESYLDNVGSDDDEDENEKNGEGHAHVNAAATSNDFLYDTTMCSSLDGPACEETRRQYHVAKKSREANKGRRRRGPNVIELDSTPMKHRDHRGRSDGADNDSRRAATHTQEEPRMTVTNEEELLQLIATTIGNAVDEVVAERGSSRRDGDFLRELENIEVQDLVDLAVDIIAAVEAEAEMDEDHLDRDRDEGDESYAGHNQIPIVR